MHLYPLNKRHQPCLPQAKRRPLLTLIFSLLVCGHGHADPATLDKTVKNDIAVGHQTQRRESEWDQQRKRLELQLQQLTEQHDTLKKDVDSLLWSNAQKSDTAASLKQDIASASRLTSGLDPVIDEQAQKAAQAVQTSLPFLQQERQQRLQQFNHWLDAPSTEQAEKLERLLELFTIETQFGHTSESWQETIELNGHPLTVQLLKVGRLALYYQTLDEAQCGVFNPKTLSFDPLPSDCVAPIKKAISLANHGRSAELVSLPIGRITLP
ncbi:DUF3450 domain-containing protein [Ferrimonas kyonanensis]|uniref:DUF3450 domain-containing protein n=1 Tax=Ferrimonas kyonanensis TaxID=364763 RepID=UPI000A03F037|nr:DUF3450 domain-containing protein [Ferrimonas kyonanensis]